jgi:hypothetical protein
MTFLASTTRKSRNINMVTVRNQPIKKPVSRGRTAIRSNTVDASVPNDSTLYTAVDC